MSGTARPVRRLRDWPAGRVPDVCTGKRAAARRAGPMGRRGDGPAARGTRRRGGRYRARRAGPGHL